MLYIGGYTAEQDGSALGVVTARRDAAGRLSHVDVTPAANPSFLATHPTLPRLYAVNEVADGTVTVLARGVGLDPLAVSPSGGATPCHVAVDAAGRRLAVANYGDGTVTVRDLDPDGLPVGPTTVHRHEGRGPDPVRQEGPHAHMTLFHDDTLYTVDLGTDRIHRYRAGSDLDPVTMPPGSGPRHLTTDGRGQWYVTSELDGTVAGFRAVDDGRWSPVCRVPASRGAAENYPSHVSLSGDGRFLYVANRGPDTIAAFTVHDGQLRYAGECGSGGDWPRHFAIVGEHLYVANQRSHGVAVFDLPGGTGLPEPTGYVFATPSPACVVG